ncbi:FHA domain-containing protein [Citricoccus sp. NPDC055426]|uniref:FHA domain-containing protein n=1 Tax=Citricoccus sp. NPDC055426 TaxID=3155536 RepID=UPI00343AFD19
MSQTVRVRYSAGGWLGLMRGRCLVALPADASEETAAVAWDLLSGTPGVEQLLATVLSGRLDLTGLPSFAIVSFREGASVHAILRGEVSLRMTTTGGGEAELYGTGVATWNERVFRDISAFEVLVDDAVSDVENLPLESGAVRLGSLHADLGGDHPDHGGESEVPESAAPQTAPASGPVAVPGSEPEPEPEPIPEPAPELEMEPEPEAVPKPEPEPEIDPEPETESPEPEPEPELDESPEPVAVDVTDQDATMVPEPRPDSTTAAESTTEDEGGEEEGAEDEDDVDDQTIANSPSSAPPGPPPEQETAPEQPAGPAASVPGPQELIDSVPWLAAARKAVPPPPPEAAAEEMVEMPADLNMTVAPAPSFEDEHGADPLDTEGTEDAADADDADTVLTRKATGTAPGPAPATPPAGPTSGQAVAGMPTPAAEDHDGETVMKSDLDPADLSPGAPTPAPAPPPSTGPVVLARQCSDGHANPPTSATCGICGQSLSGEAQQVRRPSLGRIRMSTGEVVELDRPAVVGRQPQAHRVGSGTMPRMVQVRSPNGDISRSHCEVVLEGWHVQLRDLKATNGTVLIREGQPPRRLGQGESLMVLDGDIADLGDGVSLRFEGLL